MSERNSTRVEQEPARVIVLARELRRTRFPAKLAPESLGGFFEEQELPQMIASSLQEYAPQVQEGIWVLTDGNFTAALYSNGGAFSVVNLEPPAYTVLMQSHSEEATGRDAFGMHLKGDLSLHRTGLFCGAAAHRRTKAVRTCLENFAGLLETAEPKAEVA